LKKLRRIAAAAATTAALAAVLAPSAQAHINVGLIQAGSPEAKCNAPGDFLEFLTGNPPNYKSSDNGVITSWSINAGPTPNQVVTFKIYRETSGGGFVAVAHDGPRTLTPGVNTFKVAIPVKVSDFIGFSLPHAEAVPVACAYEGINGDELFGFEGDAADGAALSTERGETKETRLNLAATLLLPPEINIFHPVSLGPISGGGAVTLEGQHFEEVSAVAFGGVPATKFTVVDEHHIFAVAPPGNSTGNLGASVTTPAGTAVYPTGFSYASCKVPKLVGKKLAAAKAAIKASGCALGKVKKVRGRRSKRGKVLKQSPKPGVAAAPGATVGIKVGR
jgi:IPT/TIG domain/PASTA domain